MFLAAGKEDFCALRTLGEVYATLTGLPVPPRITGRDGMTVLKQIRDRLTVISLTEQEYVSALESMSGSVVGGAAYGALIAKCAVKAGAAVLLTWNLRDFTRFGSEVAQACEDSDRDLTVIADRTSARLRGSTVLSRRTLRRV